jgi:GDP-L-fucose synthase|tara:strand:- start:176 stop:1120 length:945 start_codon:yes stop_codon:yes gene_type:complete
MSKKVLITGAAGMVGHYLVKKCIDRGYFVRATDIRDNDVFANICEGHQKQFEFVKADLRNFSESKEVVKDMDVVFHVAGIKGSPKRAMEQPNDYFTPILQFNTNMMEAARLEEVEWYVYTSTNGVYAPADRMREDDVWKSFPSDNDKFAGWAKRIGELQAECYKVHYGLENISIVRPANIYGRGDNFGKDSMVIPSIIKRICDGENPLVCWGDGTPTRDFIHASDIADGMLLCYDKKITEPINLGSGNGFTIKELVETIVRVYGKEVPIEWDSTKPNGDPIRLMDTTRANGYGFYTKVKLQDGIKEVMAYYNEK